MRPTRPHQKPVLSRGVWLTVVFLATLMGSCNDPPVIPMDVGVIKGVRESIASGGRTAIDVLWVIDNSTSMCEEQANLAENFRIFVEGLAELDANLQMAVITTDLEDPTHTGKFQASPATDFLSCRQASKDGGVLCTSDEDCGSAGCLCGIPHLRRCEAEDECDSAAGESCVSSGGGSTVKFCSPTCASLADCRQALSAELTEAFSCAAPPEDPDRRHCLLQICTPATGGIDCANFTGSQCVPSGIEGDGAPGYCRLFENRDIECSPNGSKCPLGLSCRDNQTCPPYADCPAPTCDCPRDLENTMRFAAGDADEAEIAAAVRNFRCLATVGTDGADIERGLGAIRFALTKQVVKEDHPGFPRDNAHLVIVILSDEDDCTGDDIFVRGDGLQCGDRGIKECVWCKDSLESVTALAAFVRRRKKSPWQVAVAAIVGDVSPDVVPIGTDPRPACASERGVAFSSDRYTSFVREFGDKLGVSESICEDSFEGPLQRLAALVLSLQDRFCLEAPVRRCTSDATCSPGSKCSYYWGEAGHCLSKGQFTSQTCTKDTDCEEAGVENTRCDDRRFCKDAGGDPADLQIRVVREGTTVQQLLSPEQWRFIPNGTFGCLQFEGDTAPGPEDSVEIRYLSTVSP